MPDTFAITVGFVVAATVVAAFIRRISRDKCLKDFDNFVVTLQEASGLVNCGRLWVENTGLEFRHREKQKSDAGYEQASYLLYKHEYPRITALIRFHDDLTDKNKRRRQRDLERTYHPGPMRRLARKTKNVFKTIRDSVAEVITMLISHAKKVTPAGKVLGGQDKYVSQMQQQVIGSVGTSYEPLLERYIGKHVILELSVQDRIVEHRGVLKEYTADFVEIMDVAYKIGQEGPERPADLIVRREYGIVRHLAE